MKVLILIYSFLLTLTACDSPMNNRINKLNSEDGFSSQQKIFESSGFQVEIKWVKGPFGNISQENHLLVLIYKEDTLASLPEGQSLEFYATMPSMGHPMDDAGFFEEVETGMYLNKSIRFNMPGDWKNELWVVDSEFNILDRLEWLMFL